MIKIIKVTFTVTLLATLLIINLAASQAIAAESNSVNATAVESKLITATTTSVQPQLPEQPLLAWLGSFAKPSPQNPQPIQAGDRIDVNSFGLIACNKDVDQDLYFTLTRQNNLRQAEASSGFWVKGPRQDQAALCLAPPIDPSIFSAASRSLALNLTWPENLVKKLQTTDALTIAMEFRLTGENNYGGATWHEVDGQLLTLSPKLMLLIEGGARDRRQSKIAKIYLQGPFNERQYWTPEQRPNIPIGEWTRLVFSLTRDDKNKIKASMLLNGQELALTTNLPNVSIPTWPIDSKLVISENTLAATPIELSNLAIWDSQEDLGQVDYYLTNAQLPAISTRIHKLPDPEFTTVYNANFPEAWQIYNTKSDQYQPTDSVKLSNLDNDILNLTFDAPAFCDNAAAAKENYTTLALRQPLDVSTAKAVRIWVNTLSSPRHYFYKVAAIFGKQPELNSEIKLVDLTTLLDAHIGAPNGRKSSLWRPLETIPPLTTGHNYFIGLKIETYRNNNQRPDLPPGQLAIANLGIDRIVHKQAKLHYVVGNDRDNFSCATFNGSAARVCTDLTEESVMPVLRLDNCIDWIKPKRPERVRLVLSVFDATDKLVATRVITSLAAVSMGDAFQKISIPVSDVGNYFIEARSYNAVSGEYFTTDWSRLIILNNNFTVADKTEVKDNSTDKSTEIDSVTLLQVNKSRPFGRYNAEEELIFTIETTPWSKLELPLTLRYAIMPFTQRGTGFDVSLPHPHPIEWTTINVDKLADFPQQFPFTPINSANHLVVELYQNKKLLDRVVKPIGIRNVLEQPLWSSPVDSQTTTDVNGKVATIEDLAGEIPWQNSQIHNLWSKPLAYFERNIVELKKLTPNLGYSFDRVDCEPIPEVYDWSVATAIFDLAAKHGCRVFPYIADKYPAQWEEVFFLTDKDGATHRQRVVWGYLTGKHNYASNRQASERVKKFNQQLARRFANHPGFGGPYYENEHFEDLFFSQDVQTQSLFQEFLQKHYANSIEKLNSNWGTDYIDFSEVSFPTYNPAQFPRYAAFADASAYRTQAVNNFIIDKQFMAYRHEDPKHPIVMYGFSATYDSLETIANNGGILANGGTHADMFSVGWHSYLGNVPKLQMRMEPHGMWSYNPTEYTPDNDFIYGLDEMLCGMLAMGGRGLNFHYFLPNSDFVYDDYVKADASETVKDNGYSYILRRWPAFNEMKTAEPLRDPVGFMELRTAFNTIGGHWESERFQIMEAIYSANLINPVYYNFRQKPELLANTKLIFAIGEVIDQAETEFLVDWVKAGGYLVLQMGSGQLSFDNPVLDGGHYLLRQLGIADKSPQELLVRGEQLAGIELPHDVYQVGAGQVLFLRRNITWTLWDNIVANAVKWSALPPRLVENDGQYKNFIIHSLQKDDTRYIAVTHSAGGRHPVPVNVVKAAQIRVNQLPAGEYKITEIFTDTNNELGVKSAAELSFDMGDFNNKQMKIFRIQPAQ